MPLFKSGDPMHDRYAGYTTGQLIQIVTDKNNSYLPGEVETARRILLARGHDYRTKEQKTAEKKLQAINQERETIITTNIPPRVRVNRQNRPSAGSGIKWWHWIWIILIMIRMIGCLFQHVK
jgi:hypothetical protein